MWANIAMCYKPHARLPYLIVISTKQSAWRDLVRPLDSAFPLTRLPVAFRGDRKPFEVTGKSKSPPVGGDYFYFLISEAIQRMATAPTIAVPN